MLNYLWAGMILIGIIFAAFTGRMPDITNAAIDFPKRPLPCITMMGVMSLGGSYGDCHESRNHWRGRFQKNPSDYTLLIPKTPTGHPAEEHITTNIIANVLGLGWAATPAGLRAMDELGKLRKTGVATGFQVRCAQRELPVMRCAPS